MATEERNVFGTELTSCSTDPETGFLRDGMCRALRRDPGLHEICVVMTEAFLEYSRTKGNDLVTPRPDLGFPGLEPGDRWCVCLARWIEALEATSEAALNDVSPDALEEHGYRE